MEALLDLINPVLGLEAPEITVWQMGTRAVVVYIFGLVTIRLVGDRRFIGKYAAFDVLLGVIMGATLSRAINGSASFFPTLAAASVLVGLHWLFGLLSFYFGAFETLLKGQPHPLITEGQLRLQTMRKSHITRRDLESVLYLKHQTTELSQVKQARLECSGDISIILNRQSPPVVDVDVAPGIQTIRIQLEP
ncbi:hypothetical protein C1752_08659 [Acaryochloris thomasi RCC1774]|uniref:YetF C-terminal domain-containing protein n=1 Tax=Acaryochloris thomasi RCC1774 TaxID=1764569 RepID=A0A2W1J9M9_9CYAN|nr:YetF domain-containing protein [Acaryochloris thomasi]PZD70973.1 hypothetical protein C1752_08659 [Acaryochloris thomasi RCC1774]